MKKASLIVSILTLALMVSAQTGKVYDQLSMNSNILGMDRNYAIYLPPDYESSERSYPVLYLLHGAGDDQTGWVQFGEVLHIADKAIREGKATPMIIVMPDANTKQRGYYNDMKDDWRYEDFFFVEFMPYIEDTYRIKKEKRYRAISGLSMGGGGTFIYALHHPELFSSACPLSAYCGPLSLEEMETLMERMSMTGTKEEMEAWYHKYSTLELIKALPDQSEPPTDPMEAMRQDRSKIVRWYIDCGDDDFLYEGNSLVHIALKKKGIPHEFRIRDGAHTWTYWRESLPKVLSFVSDAFHQH
jgi:enterochelin esterase-like enzyme